MTNGCCNKTKSSARRGRRAMAVASILSICAGSAPAESLPDSWKVLKEPNPSRSCQGGIGWSSEGEVVVGKNCGIYLFEKPSGLGRRLNNYQGWYRYQITETENEPELSAFLGTICETIGLNQIVTRVTTTPQMKSLYFQCQPEKGGERHD